MKAKEIGIIGENIATEFLLKKGFQIIERNFLKPFGEIDIIVRRASSAGMCVFCMTVSDRFVRVGASSGRPGSAPASLRLSGRRAGLRRGHAALW